MLNVEDQQSIREIVSETVYSELQLLTLGVLKPIVDQLNVILENQNNIAKGQVKIEERFVEEIEDEPWRESLRDEEL